MPSNVPFEEWRTAFKVLAKTVAKAAKIARERKPDVFAQLPYGINLPRWAIISYAASKVHEILAEMPGEESPAEVKEVIYKVLSTLDPYEVAKYYLARKPALAEKVSVDTLADAIAETLAVAKELVRGAEAVAIPA